MKPTTGQMIRKARKHAGLTQTELGRKIGVSGSMIGQWENDLRNPKPASIAKLTAATGVDIVESLESQRFDAHNPMKDMFNDIRKARKAAGLTQEALAKKLNVNRATISKYETGEISPTIDQLRNIANALDVPLISTEHRETEIELKPINPYWANICAMAEKQRKKGLETYGMGLESNPADILTRLNYLQEELIDALMYLEWIKDCLSKERGIFNEQSDTDKNLGERNP